MLNSGVQGVRLARPWLEMVTKNPGISSAEAFDHLTRVIRRVVVHYQDFP
jgi:hypothetical protein